MAWRKSGIMDERLKFVAACLEEEDTMEGLYEAYGISSKTATNGWPATSCMGH
jgi:hypothetical protein